MTPVCQYLSRATFLGLTDQDIQQHHDKGIRGYIIGTLYRVSYNPINVASEVTALTPVIQRVKARGMTVAAGLNLVNVQNASTPLAPWFADVVDGHGPGPRWEGDEPDPVNGSPRTSVRSFFESVARICHEAGFDYLNFDGEEYPVNARHRDWTAADRPNGSANPTFNPAYGPSDDYYGNNGVPSWHWQYQRDYSESAANPAFAHLDIPANAHTEAETRAKVRERGAQVAQWIVSQWPNAKLQANYNRIGGRRADGTWLRCHWMEVNEARSDTGLGRSPFRQSVIPDFWTGILSNPGVKEFHHHERWYPERPALAEVQRNNAQVRETMMGWFPAIARGRIWNLMQVVPMPWADVSPTLNEHNYPGLQNNLDQLEAAGKGTETYVALYGRSFDSGPHYNAVSGSGAFDGEIPQAIAHGASQTPAGVPGYVGEGEAPPPADCSAVEAERDAALADVTRLETELTQVSGLLADERQAHAAVRGQLENLRIAWRTLNELAT